MAISVNSISPEKLTSLLNWFKTNADDLYAKGSAGVKNVLDKALSSKPIFSSSGMYVTDGAVPDSILNKAFNVKLKNRTDMPFDDFHTLYGSYKDAVAKSKYSSFGDSDSLISKLSAAFPPLTNPDALARGDFFSTLSPRELPKEILTPQTEWMYGMRPHKNTALNKWFESQFYK